MNDSIEKSIIWKVGTIVFGTIGITATGVSYFYENYKIPLKQLEFKTENNEIMQKSKDVTIENEALIKKNSQLSLTLSKEKENNSALAKEIYSLQIGQLFSSESLYPLSVASLHLGDSIDEVKENHKSSVIEWANTDTLDPSVEISKIPGFFKSITYAYSKKNRKIYGITYEADYTIDKKFLLNKINASLGTPTTSRSEREFRWSKGKEASGYLMMPWLYMIVAAPHEPSLWQDAKSEDSLE